MRRAAWAAVACLLLLTACVGIPSSGPVEPGLPGPVPDAPDPLVRPIANPPEPGMSRTDVVRGFLAASAAIGDDYRVARLYLTPEAAGEWDPGAGVAVADDDGSALTEAQTTVTARFSQVASVLSSGVLTRQSPAPASASFPMAEVAGEWRIAAAPAGLLLSERQLERAFEVRNVYYLNPPRSSAVPDVRMLPRTDAEALATALLSALLAGPSQWLAAGVVSAIPEGMQLALGAVPVADGVAQIDLQGPGVGDAEGREQLGAQLAWTLQQVPGLTAMAVTLDGRPLPLLEGRGPVPLTAFERFDPDVVIGAPPLYGVTAQGAFAVATEGEAEPLPVAEGSAAPPVVASAAAAPRSGLVAGAAADGSGLVLLAPGRPAPRLVEGAISAGPSIDGLDRVWWVDPEGRVLQTEARDDSQVAQVVLTEPIGPVRAVRPSRDGSRVAVLAGDGPQRRLLVGVVVAGTGGRQVQGLQPLRAAGELLDVAWRSADELSVLSSGPQLLQRLDLLGSVGASFAVPETAATLADAPGVAAALGLSDGTAGRLTADGVRLVAGLSAPAYPG